MNILKFNPYKRGLCDESSLKNKIIKYLKSNSIVSASYNVTIKEFFNFFIDNKGIALEMNLIHHLSIYELIDLMLNMDTNFSNIMKIITKNYIYWGDDDEGYDNNNNIDKRILNMCKSFLEYRNIKIIKKENIIKLDFSNYSSNEYLTYMPIKQLFLKFIELENKEFNDINLEEKKTILSSLKNNLDRVFKTNNCKESNDFLKFKLNEIKEHWQTLGSHYDSKSNHPKYKKLIEEFDSLSIDDKHKKINDLINSIFCFSLFNKF